MHVRTAAATVVATVGLGLAAAAAPTPASAGVCHPAPITWCPGTAASIAKLKRHRSVGVVAPCDARDWWCYRAGPADPDAPLVAYLRVHGTR